MKILLFSFQLFIPLTMLIIGFLFSQHVPKTINPVWGYRTTRSMKNKDTWVFAHHFSGRLFKKWGLYLLVFTLLMELILMGAEDIPFAIGGDFLYIPQLIVLFIPIFLTEHALRKNFDAKGQLITKTTR